MESRSHRQKHGPKTSASSSTDSGTTQQPIEAKGLQRAAARACTGQWLGSARGSGWGLHGAAAGVCTAQRLGSAQRSGWGLDKAAAGGAGLSPSPSPPPPAGDAVRAAPSSRRPLTCGRGRGSDTPTPPVTPRTLHRATVTRRGQERGTLGGKPVLPHFQWGPLKRCCYKGRGRVGAQAGHGGRTALGMPAARAPLPTRRPPSVSWRPPRGRPNAAVPGGS